MGFRVRIVGIYVSMSLRLITFARFGQVLGRDTYNSLCCNTISPLEIIFFNSIVINTKIDIFKLVLAINLDMAAATGRRGALL